MANVSPSDPVRSERVWMCGTVYRDASVLMNGIFYFNSLLFYIGMRGGSYSIKKIKCMFPFLYRDVILWHLFYDGMESTYRH
ncbi:hypothetical protein K469DRAFT_19999 [Zopfia rhizophila CBS 207.26]|uniref:Uncharacterized protein n=1 Tax=Zopfia rhizophila CBS 207.26 TaxID=1314779 RepID=A0A6A6EXV3_9PEZI|nr:hypothetical protein K469DRAFT_19999 [Zopfia rhizophila CBS 207.26]